MPWSCFTPADAQNHIHKNSVTSETQSNIALLLQNYFPMPHLTPDCDRIVVHSILPFNCMDFKTLYVIRLFKMMIEIRISEDYCRSNIYVLDYGNVTLCHISKIIPSLMKKCEFCALVSPYTYFLRIQRQ